MDSQYLVILFPILLLISLRLINQLGRDNVTPYLKRLSIFFDTIELRII